jgi:hypothetical protein
VIDVATCDRTDNGNVNQSGGDPLKTAGTLVKALGTGASKLPLMPEPKRYADSWGSVHGNLKRNAHDLAARHRRSADTLHYAGATGTTQPWACKSSESLVLVVFAPLTTQEQSGS